MQLLYPCNQDYNDEKSEPFNGGMIPMDVAFLSPITTALLLLIIGLINCFFGYRAFSVVLVIWGFLIGYALGISLTGNSLPTTQLVVGFFGGLVGAWIFARLYKAGVFIAGALLGFLIVAIIANLLGYAPFTWFNGIGLLIGGLLALNLQRLIIIAATAFAGGWSLVQAYLFFVGGAVDPEILAAQSPAALGDPLATSALVIWIVLALLGIILQTRFTARDLD